MKVEEDSYDSEANHDIKPLETNSASSLSPNEKKRAEDNRLCAKLKLLNTKSHGVVTGIGLSWFKELETEFSKDYFKNVCNKTTLLLKRFLLFHHKLKERDKVILKKREKRDLILYCFIKVPFTTKIPKPLYIF